jgi:hypothetical protein
MFLKPCRCGLSQKNFYKDIGPYFVNECCEAVGEKELVATSTSDAPLYQVEFNVVELAKLPLSKSKIKDMPVSALKAIAKERSLADYEVMTKKQLIEALRS